jgi:ubiquinone biosynthesis protein UbiJ
MRISGDAELARQLAELAQHYRPEPAALLSPLFGDVLAQTISEGLAGAGRFARRAAGRLASSGSEYLREESRVLIAPAEQEAFIDAVETLRDDVERAEVRLNRLLSRRGAAT